MVNNGTTQSSENKIEQSENSLKFDANGQDQINIPNGKFISDAEIARDGQDLTLETSDGDKLTIENYFSAHEAPILQSPDGSILTETLVNSFLKNSDQFAQMGVLNDESPIGVVEELEGTVTITRADGSSESATLGTPIYEGDIIETATNGAANILFLDETTLAVSDDARVSVDNYQFDAKTESGETNLSVLKGVFVYTSGLIGRDDPDDVLIETPVGSIGIRGTIIAGNIQPEGKSEITVLEGAIVVSNGEGEVTLSQQFETVKINGFNDNIEQVGVKAAGDMKASYGSVQNVIPKLFSSINDNIQENKSENSVDVKENEAQQDAEPEAIEVKPEENTQEDIQSDILDKSNSNNADETIKEARIDYKLDNKQLDSNKDEIKEFYKNRLGRFGNKDSAEDTYYNPNNPNNPNNNGQGNNNGQYDNVDASGARLSGAIATQRFDYNGNGTLDTVSAIPVSATDVLNKGSFIIQDPTDGVLINAQGNIGDRLGIDYDFIGDTNNDGKLDFVVSSQNGLDGKVYTYEVGNSSPTNTVTGSTGQRIGHSVTGLGDFDGDGRSDYAYGAPGQASGNGQVTIKASTGNINIAGIGTGTEFGSHVEGLGDINGDGLSDLLIGSENTDSGLYKAYIVQGNASSNGTASTIIESPRQILAGNGIGDINGDGVDDLALSFKEGDGSVTTYAVYGQDGGFGSTINDAYLNTSGNALRIHHNINLGSGEYTINGIGDKDGDGYDDFQIGTVGGQQFVVHGENNGNSNDTDTVDGNNDGTLTAFAGNKNLVGDYDFSDGGEGGVSMRGSQYQNKFKVSNANFKNIDGGLGEDTIKIDGNLDFTNVNFEQISQIEKISMGSADGVTLTEENLFNLLKSSDTNELYIDGEDLSPGMGDESSLTINVDGSASGSSITTLANDLGGSYSGSVDANGYHHIQIGAYDLYIDADVAVSTV